MESPAGDLRNTSVVIVTLNTGEAYIITSLSSRTDTQVIYVDPTTGALSYNAKLGLDVFNTQEEAINYVTNGSRWMCKSTVYARAILGYATLGNFALLLVATKLTASIHDLPGGGCVYTVTESQWMKIALQNPQGLGKGEFKSLQELTDIDIDGKHYFCETRDITRPFPSRMPLQTPDDEFVWNQWFSMPFKNIGLPQHCVTLLQGFAECRSFGISGQQEGIVAVTARRSKLHPGTRYLARGLNSCSSTGNEVECEQLVWVPKSTGQSVPFKTYIWRRGTIPIWWGAELKITAAEAEIYVSDRDPYKGSSRYYERLSRRYDARNLDVAAQGNLKKSSLVPIVCINLLRNGLGKSECILVQHFEESLNYIRSTGRLSNAQIQLVNYDWHASIRYKGDKQTIEGLWKLLKEPTMSVGFSEGDYLPSRQKIEDCRGEVIYNNDCEGAFCLRSHQIGVIRFNCADSLDRTNAASYFGALQVFVEQCRGLGISLDSDTSHGYQSTNDDSECVASLPPGWEKRSDAVTGKTFYIDHNTRTTTWMHPCPDKPWKRFDMTFDEFKRLTVLSPVSQLADLFLTAGDIHATLYTGSKAMHSQILSIFSEETGGAFKQFSAAQNVRITLQRRYKNAIVDGSRQKQLEMFLGVRLFKHLPSIPLQPLHVFSRPSGFLLKPVINMFPGSNTGADLLSFKRKALTWACPQAADVVQLFIYLGEPCHVCQLLLTVSHGVDDTTYPSTIDVRTGRCLDGLKLVLEGASIPRCANGTNLLIPLPGAVSEEDMAFTGVATHAQDTSTLSLLYGFEELEGEVDFLTRIVAVTFYPAVLGSPMTVGEVEILGVTLPWRGMFTNEGPGARLYELAKKCQNETGPFKCRSDSNTFLSTSLSSENVTKSWQPNTSLNLSFDLLTRDDTHLESTPQPMTGNTRPSGKDLLDLSDQQQLAEADNKISSSDEANSSASSRVEYINCLKSLAGSNLEGKLGFIEAMKLEIERLRLNLSAAERDRILLSIGTDPATINPNILHDECYMVRLWKVANALALLGQTAVEDKITGDIGLEADEDNAIDFWNISRIGERCSRETCQVTVETKEPTHESSKVPSEKASDSVFMCSECKRTACKVCCAGKGALLLVNHNSKDATNYSGVTSQGGSSLGSQVDISTNRSVSLDGVVCKECCPEIVHDALILDYVRVLVSLRRSSCADTAAHKALEQILGSYSSDTLSESIQSYDSQQALKALQQVLNGEESLAEFPVASFLQSVDTATDSAPLLSVLAPFDSGSKLSYWKAPPSSASVEFTLALGTLSDVSGVILLVSSCGYSVSDAPSVQIWAGNKMDQEERLCMGKWDVQSLIAPSSECYGEEKQGTESSVPRHIKFDFKDHVRCRIIWMTLCLQRPRSTSISLGTDFNVLCEDENPCLEENRRASLGGPVERDPCLHAKRVLVVGKPVRDDIALSSAEPSEPTKLKNWLERTPQLNRFKVPVDAERLMNNDLVLEQYLPFASPMVAGFRLDAFTVIQRHVTHSPSSHAPFWDASSTFLEDRHISPAVLYVQVSVFQEPNSTVKIGEYRLPQIKAGMPLYYDFPKQIQSRRITFKLLGDVSSFTDDPEDSRGLSVAAGLSLSNRVKLYYYADPYEVGKWASLSAV